MKIKDFSSQKATELLSQIDSERAEKSALISSEVSRPQTLAEITGLLEAFASSINLTSSEVRENSKTFYTFLKSEDSEKYKARVLVFKDSNLGRLEILGTNRFAKLGIANLNSSNGFSIIED